MQDSAADTLIAAKMLAGHLDGRAEMYDRHAAELYEYCVTMLRDGERARSALTTTLMIATGRLAELPDRGRLRPWLFALARDECRRRARSGRVAAARSGRRRSRSTDKAEKAGKTDEADLFPTALATLGWEDREVIALCLRHHLVGEDLADVLGMPDARVRTMVTDARVRLQRAVGALFVVRTARADCHGLARVLKGWDGHLDEPVIRRVRGHIRSCGRCRARELRELPSWEVLAARSDPAAPGLLSGIRPYVLESLAVGSAPAGDLIADLVRHRTGLFSTGGFPDSANRENGRLPVQVAGVAAGVAAAGAMIVLFAGMPGSGPHASALARATKSAGAAAAGPGRAGAAAAGPGRSGAASVAPAADSPEFRWLGSVIRFAAG
ncbi:MAG TPA: sigma-70 family RNA polymerase sigma factor [Streptosporangiaceae bacterium]